MVRHFDHQLLKRPFPFLARLMRFLIALLLTTALLPLTMFSELKEAFAATLISVCIPTGTTMTCVDSEGTKIFSEGQFGVEGSGINKVAYCVNYAAQFRSGQTLTAADATTFIPKHFLTKMALANMCAYNGDYSNPNNVVFYEFGNATSEQRYYLVQAYIWLIMGEALGYTIYSAEPTSGPGSWGSTSAFNEALAYLNSFVAATQNSWIGTGTVYYGAGQQIAMDFDITPAAGWIDLFKQSSNTPISQGNTSYDLGGAVYGICDDAAAEHEIARLSTNSEGYATSDDLSPGNYYVKEKVSAFGYALDKSIYQVTVSAGQTTRVNNTSVKDVPQNNPADLWVKKIDAETGENVPQGAASLVEAEYTVKYYEGCHQNDPAKTGHTPLRTWVVKTDEQGSATLSESSKVSGDAFYYASDGQITIPLGTITIQETKAPEGYLLNSDTIHVRQITGEGTTESVTTYAIPLDKEQVKRGDWRITKEVPTTNDAENQSMTRALVEGILFEFYNDNPHAVVAHDGMLKKPGELVCTIITDANGDASTKDQKIPNGWGGALVYGNYIVKEVIPQKIHDRYQDEFGISLLPIDEWKINISEEGQYHSSQLISNKIPQTPIRIIKKDAITEKAILASCTFQIFDAHDKPVTYTDHYNNEVIDRWRTNNTGELILPMKLDQGTYTLFEVEAPSGYLLNTEGVMFTVDTFNTWDNPITIEFFDEPIMARIELSKADSDTSEALCGAEYSLRAATDIQTGDGTLYYAKGDLVSSGIETNECGFAVIEGLHLGRYLLYETKAPQGYALDTNEYPIDIVSQGQEIPIVNIRQDLENRPTTLRIFKTDLFTKEPLEGAVFKIWNECEGPNLEYALNLISSEVEQAVLEQDETISQLSLNDELGLLEELMREVGGYSTSFFATGQYINSSSFKPFTFVATLEENMSIRIDHEDRTLCSIPPFIIADPHTFEFEGSTDSQGILRIPYLAPGTYYVQEVMSPSGYLLDQKAEIQMFRVDDQGMISGLSTFDIIVTNHRIEIGTTAVDGKDSDKRILNDKQAVIVDTVSYSNLKVGKEYTVCGTLMSKLTGEALLIDDRPVISEVSFFADSPDGTMDITFNFDAISATGIELVVFETLFEDGIEVAKEADINNLGQTVEIIESATTESRAEESPGNSHDKTGNPLEGVGWLILGMFIASGIAGGGYALYQKRRMKLERKELLDKSLRW